MDCDYIPHLHTGRYPGGVDYDAAYFSEAAAALGELGRGEAVLRQEFKDPRPRASAKPKTAAQKAAIEKNRQIMLQSQQRALAKTRVQLAKDTPAVRALRKLAVANKWPQFFAHPYIKKQKPFDGNGNLKPTFNLSLFREVTVRPDKNPSKAGSWQWDHTRVVPWKRAELKAIYKKYHFGRGGCEDDEISRILSAQAKGLKAPLKAQHQLNHARIRLPFVAMKPCRKDEGFKGYLKTVAVLAAIGTVAAVGGQLLATKLAAGKGAAAAGAAAGKSGGVAAAKAASAVTAKAAAAGAVAVPSISPVVTATIGGKVITATAVGKGLGVASTIAGAAKKYAPVAEKVINSARTVAAVAKGELPPPPISLGDGNFTDYATAVGKSIIESKLARKIREEEEQLLRAQVEAQRRDLARYAPLHAPIVNTGLHPELVAAQRARADQALGEGTWMKVLLIGLPVVAAVMAGG